MRFLIVVFLFVGLTRSEDVFGCGGFIQASIDIDFSEVAVKLYSKSAGTFNVKYTTDCAPNGYFLIPLYEKGNFRIKVESKRGWNFKPTHVDINVDGETDPCSKGVDINFVFSGVSVRGRVISQGQLVGPAGVSLSLIKNSEVATKIKTVQGGMFDFPDVLPGRHVLKAEHAQWAFTSAEADVNVLADSVSIKGNIIVTGYEVKGGLENSQGPKHGAEFILTCLKGSLRKGMTVGCSGSKLKKAVTSPLMSEDEEVLCTVKSDTSGKFSFNSVPTGDYFLYTHFQTDVNFEVIPEKSDIHVGHGDIELATKFEVTGFTIAGRVLYSKGGKGIPLADIKMKEFAHSLTDSSGYFTFDGVTSGTYEFDIHVPKLLFVTKQMKVSPKTFQLPDFLPDAFQVCGHVTITSPPNTLTRASSRSVTVTSLSDKKFKMLNANWDEGSDFCFYVPSGDYVVRPVLTESDTANGLALAPAELHVKVADSPVDGLLFSQFQAQVNGRIQCVEKGKCERISVNIQPKRGGRYHGETKSNSKGLFTFDSVLPGQYEVSVLKEVWCWKDAVLRIDIKDQDADVVFVQEGYFLSCVSSHAVNLVYTRVEDNKTSGELSIRKGVNKVCLSKPGKYLLKPVSCHRFEHAQYEFDTGKPVVIQLTAHLHRFSGTVVSAEPLADMKLHIQVKSKKEKNIVSVSKPTDVKGEKTTYVHQYEFWAPGGDAEIVPVLADFLCKPPSRFVKTPQEGCPDRVQPFQCLRGLYVEGGIRPPIEGVQIRIARKDEEIYDVMTNSQGLYRYGPIEGGTEYSVSAMKDGYVLTEEEGDGHNFKAIKLGYLTIQISTTEGQRLAGVLLSLTGQQYRNNTLTGPSGSLTYRRLIPGTYFARPLLKEYEFEPVSQTIKVDEESEEVVDIKGRQVAFSCYGYARSLNGLAEEGVTVQAQGLDACSDQREETKTNKDGDFRLRGLKPGCSFSVQISKENDIVRSLPDRQIIKVQDADTRDVNLVVIRQMGGLELSGNVISDPGYLPSIRVNLYQEGRQDSPLHTVSLGSSAFFFFPMLQADGKAYVLKLDTQLPEKQYAYDLPPGHHFIAKGTVKHVTFEFHPTKKITDTELTAQGSLLAVGVIIAVAAAIALVFQTRLVPAGTDRPEPGDYDMRMRGVKYGRKR